MSDDPILSALVRLESGLGRLETVQTRLRVDLMARIDRIQSHLDSLDEYLTPGLDHNDHVERRARSVAEDNRLLGAQIMTLTKLLRQLEGRINSLEDRK